LEARELEKNKDSINQPVTEQGRALRYLLPPRFKKKKKNRGQNKGMKGKGKQRLLEG
jgi:hypothetical protein